MIGWRRRFRTLSALAAAVLGLSTSCTAITHVDIGRGIGASCTIDSECQNGICLTSDDPAIGPAGICSNECANDRDCVSGASCVKGHCRLQMHVGAIFVGSVNNIDGWTSTHNDGLVGALSTLGFEAPAVISDVLPDQATKPIQQHSETKQIVIANGIDYEKELRAAAMRNPKVAYLMVDNNIYDHGDTNLTPFGIHLESAFYLAGRAAGLRAKTRLGIIGSLIGPETIRIINAFTLGARSIKPSLVVEVRYVGFFNDINTQKTQVYEDPTTGAKTDYYREELLTRQLIDTGCEVIAHYTNIQRSVRLIDALDSDGDAMINGKPVASIAVYRSDGCLDGAGRAIPSCLGTVTLNWESLYRRTIDRIARGIFDPLTPIRQDLDDSDKTPVSLVGNPAGIGVDVSALSSERIRVARALAPEPHRQIFKGPYQLNGQRDSDFDGIPDPPDKQQIKDGEILSLLEEYRTCYFVQGVVEKLDPDNPASADRPALVPGGLVPGATQPDTSVPRIPERRNNLTLPSGVPVECRKNSPPLPTP